MHPKYDSRNDKQKNYIPFLNQRWYRGGKEEATRRIVHTLRKPTTQPTKIALWF